MKRLTTYIGIVAALVVAVVAVPLAQAADPSPAELKALEIRGQALNQLCEDSTLTGVGYRALCGTTGASNRPTASELRALEIRGQALNQMCGDSTLVGSAYRSLCGTTGASNRPTASELRALEIRGQALNQLCAGSSGEISATLCGRLATGQVTQVTRSSGFDWSDFGIGAGAMLGFVLLAGGIRRWCALRAQAQRVAADGLVGAEFQDPAGAGFVLTAPAAYPPQHRRWAHASCSSRTFPTTA